jgi:SAM-dependent methyltransferase
VTSPRVDEKAASTPPADSSPQPIDSFPQKFDQRSIYDRRYSEDGYDNRSAVRVLRAEEQALRSAALRALRECTEEWFTVLDFGYGTGRVTNDFIEGYPGLCQENGFRKNLRVIAYDVSSVGLEKAHQRLVDEQHFTTIHQLGIKTDHGSGYVMGSARKITDGIELHIIFVHADEEESAKGMTELVLRVNGNRPVDLTTSWYSGIGHITGHDRRESYFTALGRATHSRGELLVAVSATGDLDQEQEEWDRRRDDRKTLGMPVPEAGDVIYLTELDQKNYWHVFSDDLTELLKGICGKRQGFWLEAIRFPGEEFSSRDDERPNFEQVCEFNRNLHCRRWQLLSLFPGKLRGRKWRSEHFRSCHTVAAIRSGSRRRKPTDFWYSEPSQSQRSLVPKRLRTGRPATPATSQTALTSMPEISLDTVPGTQ